MRGRKGNMRSGPKAIHYQGTLFRVSELVWVKVQPLPIWRLGLKVALMILGVLFYVAVGTAKGSYWNIEGILGFLALHIGYSMRGDVRLATSGDLTESYDGRGAEGDKRTFGQWVQALGDGPDECKLGLQNGPYQTWFNLQRIAWARHSFTFDFYGLAAIPVYMGYKWLIARNLHLALSPLLRDLNLLQFEGGDISNVSFCCLAIAVVGGLTALTSIQRVVEVRACGGLSDTFSLSSFDRVKFFEKLAGLGEGAAPASADPVTAKPAASIPASPPKAAEEAVKPANSYSPKIDMRPSPAPAAPAVEPPASVEEGAAHS